jgi:hypothetical protein
LKPRAEPRHVSAPRRFDIDCELAYKLPAETHFLFQVHALHGMDQAILSESLTLTPNTPHHVYADPAVGHRFLRVCAAPGPLTVRYQAAVVPRFRSATAPTAVTLCRTLPRRCECAHQSRLMSARRCR